MKTETDRATQTPEDVLNELHSLVGEVERIVAQASQGSCSCNTTLAALRGRVEAAQERLSAIYEGAKRNVVAGAKCADATIRDNPYQSIAIAAGVGLLAGVLLSRSCKPSSE